jgi:hypothetical protein
MATSAPGSNPLKIGAVTFSSIECPNDLPIGSGEQRIKEMELVGGGKSTYSMGAQADPVTWKGAFFDENVDARILSLRRMMTSGQEYFLTWHTEQYYGKVKKFVPTYHHTGWCEYEITVVITRDANGAFSKTAPVSVDQQVNAMLQDANLQNSAILAADPVGAAVFQPDLSTMNVAIKNAGPLAQTAGLTAQSVIQSIGSAIAAVGSYSVLLSELAPQTVAVTRLASILTLVQTAIQLGQTAKTIRTQGGSLFEIAAQEYGDVTQAFALMAANGLSAPVLSHSILQDVALPPYGKA